MNHGFRKRVQSGLSGTIAAAAIALSVLAAGSGAVADEAAGQVWLISTRRAPPLGQVGTRRDQIAYWRLQADNRWLKADADDLLDTGSPPIPTTIFIHGNRTNRTAAIGKGWRVYRQMRRDAAGQPFRLVIWSWPSDRIRGRRRRDVRVKAGRCDVESYHLAECLDRIHPNVPVSLIGYSFGARVITGALHLVAGGQIAGRSLPERTVARPTNVKQKPIRRALLVAPALDSDWLMPGRRNGLALSQVERVLVVQNWRDPCMKWYPLIYRVGGPKALGFATPGRGRLFGAQGEKIEVLDVSGSVGRVHEWSRYMAAPGIGRRLAWYAYLEPSGPEDAPQGPILTEGPVLAERTK